MKVGDLVTLSASGRGTVRNREKHMKFFATNYYWPDGEEMERFQEYWKGTPIGLVTTVRRYNVEQWNGYNAAYELKPRAEYGIVWVSNPKSRVDKHIRSHLKFVSRASSN